MQDLLGRELRANPAYELVLWDRLAPEERRVLDPLREDPDFYGVLRRRESPAGPGAKAVDRETALLFLTLREPGSLPAYVRSVLGAETGRTVGRLVADGVLEVREGDSFVSGPAAFAGGAGRGPSGGRLAALSLAALRYAQALPTAEPLRLASRLYGYNRQALSPRWQRLLSSADAVRAHLGLGPGGASARLLDEAWSPSAVSAAWLSWQQHGGKPQPSSPGATYKLYVSPRAAALGAGFGAILEALAAARAPAFKIGAGAAGLLRPDKIVAYFPSFDRLAEAAAAMAPRLAGLAVQGVPFTSEIAGDGLLSWGMDPPAMGFGSGQESWRQWLTRRLAQALLAARGAAGNGCEPWRFALERLGLEGIDTDTWTPGAQFRLGG